MPDHLLPHERLEQALKDRKAHIAHQRGRPVTWEEVAREIGTTYEGLRNIRNGAYKPTNLAWAIDKYMGWPKHTTLSLWSEDPPDKLPPVEGPVLPADAQAGEGAASDEVAEQRQRNADASLANVQELEARLRRASRPQQEAALAMLRALQDGEVAPSPPGNGN